MVSKKQKKDMKDYLVTKLSNSGHAVKPVSREIVSGITSNYLLIDEEGLVLLVDQAYPRDSLNSFYQETRKRGHNFGAVLFKDGELFFRNAADKNYFKKDKYLSLKKYSNEEMHRMILFRPEEIFLNEKRSHLQYYQPSSANLNECLTIFNFQSLRFDYSHIDESGRFKPSDKESKRLYIWNDRKENADSLRLEKWVLFGNTSEIGKQRQSDLFR